MSCECTEVSVEQANQRQVVRTALILNVLMFLVGAASGVYGSSMAILSDALDMAADAAGYGISLAAIGRSSRFRVVAARWTGGTLIALGIGIIAESLRRWFTGSDAMGPIMMGYSALSLCVNVYVLVQLSKIRGGGTHLNASYICTRTDVLANLGVLCAGTIIWVTGAHWVDLIAGIVIAILVFTEAREIFEDAGAAESESAHDTRPA